MYEPLQIALQNLAAIISLDANCKRMDEILSHEEQTGSDKLDNKGYDITFDHVAFSYKSEEQVLSDVSFTAKQGEITALIICLAEERPLLQGLRQDFGIMTRAR